MILIETQSITGKDDCMDAGGTITGSNRYDHMEVGGSECQDAYRDISGTTTWMWEVVNVWNTFSRATQEAKDEGLERLLLLQSLHT